jgi:membrane protein DedA with SNARE-associated domain
MAGFLQQRGAVGVAVARATPGVRVGATAASGLAALPFAAFLPGLVAGNTLFVGGHFALGYLAGPPALALIAGSGGIALAIGALVVLAVLGALAWRHLRHRRAAASAAGAVPDDLPSAATWAEAACPACIAVALLRDRRG